MRWVTIKGTKGRYKLSDQGDVYSVKTGKTLKPRLSVASDRLLLVLSLEGERKFVYVHKLVAQYFVPNNDPKFTKHPYHIDGDVRNNHHSNLEWRRRIPWMEKVYSMPVAVVHQNGDIKEFTSLNQAAKSMNVNHLTVKNWLHGYGNKRHKIQVLDL